MNASSAMHPAALVAASIDMQRVYGARDLAGMKIPGAPTTPQGIKKMALREGWRFVKQSGRGGGDGYPVTALPQAWQAFILRPAIEAARAQDAETQPQTVKIANMRKKAGSGAAKAKAPSKRPKNTLITISVGGLVIKISRSASEGIGR